MIVQCLCGAGFRFYTHNSTLNHFRRAGWEPPVVPVELRPLPVTMQAGRGSGKPLKGGVAHIKWHNLLKSEWHCFSMAKKVVSIRKVPSGDVKRDVVKSRNKTTRCAVCGKPIKKSSRPFGGYICGNCLSTAIKLSVLVSQ
jgi:ribosomal protein L34E